MNLSIPYFREGRNNVASFIGKIRLRTPMEQVVLSDRSRFWTRQIWPQQQSKYYDATPPAQQILKAANFSATSKYSKVKYNRCDYLTMQSLWRYGLYLFPLFLTVIFKAYAFVEHLISTQQSKISLSVLCSLLSRPCYSIIVIQCSFTSHLYVMAKTKFWNTWNQKNL